MKTEKLNKVEKGWENAPLGLTKTAKGYYISVVMPGEDCSLVLWEQDKTGSRMGERRIPFSQSRRIGDVWFMELEGRDFDGLFYCLKSGNKLYTDPCGRAFSGREKWGTLVDEEEAVPARFPIEEFDWEEDKKPSIPYEDSVIYQIHTRGFTKHSSSHVKEKGTFGGIIEKIDYLKELGVTAVKLLPVYEFSELMTVSGPDKMQAGHYSSGAALKETPAERINYWGYLPGLYFAPKASYGSRKEKNSSQSFKRLVKELHKNDLEIIIELYFTGKESPSFVQDVLHFWVGEYHVDGIHLTGYADTGYLAKDPFLTDTKLLANSWECRETGRKRYLGECNDGFLSDMRKFLKGDEGLINNLIFRTRRNPGGCGVINYMAETNGFTMMDMVSYERKHNEANGENNQDGSDNNFTWNCGAEGVTRKKKVLEMRKKQLRNAFLLLLLSQGTPLILAGDEFGATKGGNNNAYCQDNEVSWLNWNLLNTNKDIYQFVKTVLAFRRRHPVFHQAEEPRVMDYLACGHPDVSYHGEKAWRPEFENFRRQLGIMYCGDYCQKADKTKDDTFFAAYNMHWESHEFALPKLSKGLLWHVIFNTDESERNGIYGEGEELLLKDQKQFEIPPRSIVVFSGLKTK